MQGRSSIARMTGCGGPQGPRPASAGGRASGGAVADDDGRAFFEAEVERLLNRLYGTALRLTRNGADAEDLTAEAIAKAWANLSRLQDRQSFERWIFRILVNTFISERRRSRPEPAGDLNDEACGEGGFSLYARLHQPFLLWWGQPEQDFLHKLLREDIARAIDALPECFRVVFILVEVQGFSYAEAAETIGLPVGTVRSRLSRGRALLQRALWQEAGQLGIGAAADKDKNKDTDHG